MSKADEAIARVRKLDALTREKRIVIDLVARLIAGNVRLGVMDEYGTPDERRFSEFPTTSTERFIEIAKARIDELGEEIEATRAEFDKDEEQAESTPEHWLPRWWRGR